MISVYGLKNCDSCRRARRWLDDRGTEYRFVDLRESSPDPTLLERWLDAVGVETLVNRRSTTWRGLDDAERARALDEPASLLGNHPTLIKRPVLDTGNGVTVGFDPDPWRALIS